MNKNTRNLILLAAMGLVGVATAHAGAVAVGGGGVGSSAVTGGAGFTPMSIDTTQTITTIGGDTTIDTTQTTGGDTTKTIGGDTEKGSATHRGSDKKK